MDTLAFLALACLVFILPWQENFTIEGFETCSRLFGAVAFLLGLAAVAMTLSLKRLHRALVPLIAFVVWSFVSMLWSIDREATLDRSIGYLLLLVFAWLVWQYSDSVSRQQWLMRVFIFGTAVALAAVFVAFRQGGNTFSGQQYERFTASGANANFLVICFIVAINFAVYLATRPGGKSTWLVKLAYWTFIVLAGLGVFLTGSRSGVLALGVSVFLTLVMVFRVVGWKPAVIFMFCVLIGGYVVAQFVPEHLLSRVQEVHTARSFHDRLDAWQTGLAKWTERPLQGFGSATNGGPDIELAHNTLISILVDDGLVGLGLYVAFWILLLLAIFSLPKVERNLWLIVFASYGPSFLSLSAEHDKTLWFLCALMLAQSATLRRVALPTAPTAPLRTMRFRPA